MGEYKKEVINYSFQESSKMNDLISDSKRDKMLNGDSLEELISKKCSEDIESASEKNTSSSRKGFVLLLIGVVCLFSTVLLLLLLPLSNGCLRMRADPLPCSTCPQTLGNTNLVDGQCAVHRTCVSCTSTQVAYSRSGQCLIASVTCPNVLPSNSPRVRLLKADNTYVDIAYTSALSLSCTSGSSWTYIDGTGTPVTNIKKAICFGKMENTQESPIDLNTNTAVHTSLYNASQFKVSYGSGIIDHISVARTYGGFHAVMKANANAFFTASHLDARYRLVQYHGHWNMDTLMRGSEHTIDGIPFNAELHFVHMREDFTSFQQAVAEGGVAVIGILLHV
ncbi:hypothetical protein PRIPAC_77822 [Pristionchus pacificus]|uniref:Carbonic anhydrase n=1 Tax=Pristionchus pacificus TaxID=54126 RepID=A0A2A6BE98_PRIPA|nr:hypothetical protein PRIPAC_77822 [Pristionchus pacificus]|eukprot:PDM64193.1 hypothetical protein PRIPAC_54437 [Pristionchus pacificus]